MDVTAYMLAEVMIGFEKLNDFPGFNIVHQTHRFSGENPTITLQICSPCGVANVLRQAFCDIDGVGIEALGDQCHPARKIIIDLLFRMLSRAGHAFFQIANQFIHFDQLIAQAGCGRAGSIIRACRSFF